MESNYCKEIMELIDFLRFPNSTYLPQTVLADKKTKRAIAWYPGTKGRAWIEHNPDRYLIGFTGKFYQDNLLHKDKQKAQIHFLTVDIDLLETDDFEQTKQAIVACLGNYCSVRTSTKGHGFHLIFRLDTIMTHANRTNVQATLKPYLTLLEQSRIKVCTYGINTYLLGGLQTWLHKTNARIPCWNETDSTLANYTTQNQTNQDNCPFLKYLNKQGKELVALLAKEGITLQQDKTDIYIKAAYQALKGTKYEFKTKSPMASENRHINGFIVVDNVFLHIFACADNKIVATYPIFF